MILLKSLIVILFLLIISHLFKFGFGTKKEKAYDGYNGFNRYEGYENLGGNANGMGANANGMGANGMGMGMGMGMEGATTIESSLMGGEIASPVGAGQLAPSQKVQEKAKEAVRQEKVEILDEHKELADNALNMKYLKTQMDELQQLGNQAQVINENFKNLSQS